MKKLLFSMWIAVMLFAGTARMQAQHDGLWEGYDGEWGHVSQQLVELAEAIPPDKYGWRPAPGVRSTSEVYMHIAIANFYLLNATGRPMPPEMKAATSAEAMEKSKTAKADVVAYLKQSLEAVKTARAELKPGDLQKRVEIEHTKTNVDGIYLRILIHDNEHMGQLIAYARMMGVVPPWSAAAGNGKL